MRTGVSWMDGRSDDVGRTAAGAGDGRPAAIGRLSASVPAPRSSSIRPRSGLLKVSITTFVVQAGRADGQGQAAASLRSARPVRAQVDCLTECSPTMLRGTAVERRSSAGDRTFPVLRSTCGWRMIIYVAKPSAIGQPTRPTQPSSLQGR